MTYRIVDVATNARVGSDIVGDNASCAIAKARTLARLAGGSFRVVVAGWGKWYDCALVTEGA